jgi:hypothetical protein
VTGAHAGGQWGTWADSMRAKAAYQLDKIGPGGSGMQANYPS